MPQVSENFSMQTRSKNRDTQDSSVRELGVDLKNIISQTAIGSNNLQCSQPISALKLKSGSMSRPRSVSFSTPEFREGSKSSDGSNPESPMRLRSHTSEAGSPTIEQAILMGRDSPGSDAGYGSFQSGFLPCPDMVRREEESAEKDSMSPTSHTTDRSYSPGEPRPTLATLVEADLAVAQAVQNLQNLKEKQAAIYEEMNISPKTATDSILGSLLTVTQGSKTLDNQLYDGRDVSGRTMRDTVFERDLGATFDNESFTRTRDPLALERAARQYRNAASLSEAKRTWTGQLLPKHPAGRNASYSSKVFLGGVPWDITELALLQAFKDFGPVRVEWPGKDTDPTPKGYLYIVFEDENCVKDLLNQCAQDFSNGGSYYYKIVSQKRGMKDIQVIPWLVDDSTYIGYTSPQLDPKKTVFVGALHGMMNAQSLALIFNDLFGDVVFAGLDTDKHKYPIGSGRVTFSSAKAFRNAVNSAFIEIKTSRFQKKIQVDPYLEDAICSLCQMKQGPYFCRDDKCFEYFCRGCWDRIHVSYPHHKPLMRNIRGLTRARLQDLIPDYCNTTPSSFGYTRESNKVSNINYWGDYDQEKRFDSEHWRSSTSANTNGGYMDNHQFTRRGQDRDFEQTPSWRQPGHTSWRSQEKEPSWMSNSSEFTWDDDQSKLSAIFADTLNFSASEKATGLKPFYDDLPVFKPRDGFTSLRSSFGDRSYRDALGFSSGIGGGASLDKDAFTDRALGFGPSTSSLLGKQSGLGGDLLASAAPGSLTDRFQVFKFGQEDRK